MDGPKEHQEGTRTGTSNGLIVVALIFNALVMGGSAYLQLRAHYDKAQAPGLREVVDKLRYPDGNPDLAPGEGPRQEGFLFPLDPFTANLSQSDGPQRYVRLSAVLKFSPNSEEKEFEAKRPQIRDAFISLLNSKRPEDLLKREGKVFLKEELKSSINSILIDGKVLDIYYVSFQIN